MKGLITGMGLFLVAAFAVIFFTQVTGFATSGDLTGNEQTIFDQLPTILLIIGAMAGAGMIIALGMAGWGRRR